MNKKIVGIIVLMFIMSTTIQVVSSSDNFSNKITSSNIEIKNEILPTSRNGRILDQQLNENGQGYTIMQLWGSYYDMGYANAKLLGDVIVDGINEIKDLLGEEYGFVKYKISESVWPSTGIKDEINGMVDCLAKTHPDENIDKGDIKVINTIGDWWYNFACRSHSCWGRYVSDPVKTLSTRRLDFPSVATLSNHHILAIYLPNDDSTKWINFGFPGHIVSATGVNEYGTVGFIHDCIPMGLSDLSPDRMARSAANRYALLYPDNPDISTHIDPVYSQLQGFEIMTKCFLNYYVPEGYGGVMTCNPWESGPDFYELRYPQEVWHHGEAIITTNKNTDGTTTPPDEDFGADAYYGDETPKTLESHWDLLDETGGNLNLHLFSVEYRGHEDMTIWAQGRLDGVGRTPRLEYEWSDLTKTVSRPVTISVDKNNNHSILTRLFEQFPNVLPFLRILIDFC